ncbi:MAG: ribonuclease R [Parcubacteria group bacterium CG11_big_fil_rev_8_21_14_0_20_39_22]|nr:MAG: ribonuclease R [Parcubacteria group bacterium CG11_big_fil_rev_8_21_14_0_20_39_22]
MSKQKQEGHRSAPKDSTYNGIITITKSGIGYITPDEPIKGLEYDIEISSNDLETALNKDRVSFSILAGPDRRNKNAKGKVIEILERSKTQFVGTLIKKEGSYFLMPDDHKMYAPIEITDGKEDLKENYKALVAISNWEKGESPEGKLIEQIGPKGDHNTEMNSIVLERGFLTSFPKEVEREAEEIGKRSIPIPEEEIAKRKDFRKATTFTIDPKTAKDFDDALSVEMLGENLVRVGIHIADVSHYVREGSSLDKEAKNRSFSVYLVDRTIPMLPEILSNELCSLKPGEDRLAFSAVFEMDLNTANVKSRWFGKTVIHSNKRFTYEDAQEIIDRNEGQHFEELNLLKLLARKLREEKKSFGAIDFETEEFEFELDENGTPVSISKKERMETHKLVEEFMLLANREVAEFFYTQYQKSGNIESAPPFLYRIHDIPDEQKIEELGIFVRALGHELPISPKGGVTGKDLQALFAQIEGKANESLIKTAAIRSMSKAIYSTENIGHFGLAFEYYTHFTSPIRRYPDLIVHRFLFACLSNEKLPKKSFQELQRVARNASDREVAAMTAERDSKKLKQVQYMSNMVGKEFDGTISGVTKWGIYIAEEETGSEGMVRLSNLGGDYYKLGEKNYAIVGERTGKRYSLGDKVRFKVTSANPEERILDYKIVE